MPFNSQDKFALTIVQCKTQDSEVCIYIKGAPEKIWKRCSYIQTNSPYPTRLNDEWQKKFNNVNLQLGKMGERVLGFAKLHLPRKDFPADFQFDISASTKFNFVLDDLTFIGLISLIDPPKDAVPMAVKKCRSSGIKVIMVTGDQPPTAAAIAKQVNIIPADMKTNIDILEERPGLKWEDATDEAKAIVVHGDKINEVLE